MHFNDQHFMKMAIKLAKEAGSAGDAPVGAIAVKNENIIGEGRSESIISENPVRHAEILALEMAADSIGSRKLFGTDLYVTMEPCPMCAGAIYQSRVSRLIYGIRNPKINKTAFLTSSKENNNALETKYNLLRPQNSLVKNLYRVLNDHGYRHQVEIIGGVMGEDCRKLWTAYIKHRKILK